jgi:putative ABC transport system permease protein
MNAGLRSTWQSLRRSPAFVLTVVATLGIGIGMNAAIFAVVDCVLLRPLGYHDADRIVAVRTHFVDESRSIPRLGGEDYSDLARDVKGLEATAFYYSGFDGAQVNGGAFYLPVANVSPRFGEVMGVEPVAGHLFENTDTAGQNALVSASFAREHFGSARAAVGKAILYTGALRSIVGVLPDGFSFPGKTTVWFETKPAPQETSRTSYSSNVVGKRRAGITPQQLDAELAAFSRGLQHTFPEDRHKTLEAVSLQEQLTGGIRPTLHLLMGSVGVILLIVCANVTHLQLVRATRQLRAVTIRTALGASRAMLASRALSEASLLAAAGSAAAVLLAVPALRLLVLLAPASTPRLADIHLNVHELLFSFLVSLLLMSLTAVFPVWRSWHVDPASVLRQDAARGTESRSILRLRNSLVVAEVALTLALSVSAILLARQLIAQSRQDLGFAAEHLVTLDTHAILSTPAPVAKDHSPASQAAVAAAWTRIGETNLSRLDAAQASLSSVPGVESVAAIAGAPMGFDGPSIGYAVKGRQSFAPGVENLPSAEVRAVTPGLLATLRVPLLRGRGLSPEDRVGAPLVVLVSNELARKVFPGQDPIGRQVTNGYDADSIVWTIVGVVGDIRSRSPGAAPDPTMYIPVAQHAFIASDMQLVVRTRLEPAAMAETLRKRLEQTHPEIAVTATTMRENIGVTERADQFRTVLFASFAAVSILLAGVGLYGVTSYTVAQRRFEFGLRIALGANRAQMLGLVLRNTAKVTAVGIAIGIGLSLAVSRVLGSVVGQLPAFDALAYALAALAVLLLSLLATLLPARAAASVDPMQVLRSE